MRSSTEDGFTLLEILVALGIFALIGAASYTLLSSETRSQQRLQAASLHLNYWQKGMLRLSLDMQQIAPRGIREDYGSREPAFIGDSNSLTFTHAGWSNPLRRQRSNLQRVHYEVISSAAQPLLQRSFWSVLDRAPDSVAIRQTLIPGVEAISLRYLALADGDWHEQWPPLNSGTATGDLPRAVEIILTSPRLGDVRRLFPVTLKREPE